MRGSSKRRRLNEGVEEGVEGALVLSFACREEDATGAREVGGWCPCMVATHQRRVHPLRHSVEHVSGDGVAMVESDFGPATGRNSIWTRNEVFQARLALQL